MRIVFIFTLLCCFLPIFSARADAPNYSQDLKSENSVILQVSINDWLVLDEVITGYKLEKKVFLSLKQLAQILEFQIKFDDNYSAQGWFANEENKFSLDFIQNEALIKEKKYPLSKDEVIILPSEKEIYVDINTLSKWFGYVINFNENEQLINIVSNGSLAIEQRLAREKRSEDLKRAKNSNQNNNNQNITIEKAKYQAFSIPVVDVRYNYALDNVNKKSSTNSTLNTFFSGDLLYLNHQFLTSFQGDQISNVRLTSGQKDAQGDLLGPLHATEFSLGDVFTPPIPLVAFNTTGAGVRVSNYPDNYVSEFSKITIRNNLQPGWDVELYRNDVLIDSTSSTSEGFYEFVDIPLIQGVNNLKFIFYGPAGERREESKRYMVSNNVLQKGKFYYRLTSNKNNKDLILVNESEAFKNDATYGVSRDVLELSYGLTDNLSLTSNYIKIPIFNSNAKQNEYWRGSVNSSLFGFDTRFDLIKDVTQGDIATQTSIQTSIFDYNVIAQYSHFQKDFISEEHQVNVNPISDTAFVKLDGGFNIPFLNNAARLMFSLNRDDFYFGQSRSFYESELSVYTNRLFYITQNFRHIIDTRLSDENRVTNFGRTVLNYRPNNSLYFRGTLSYNVKPKYEMTNSIVNANYTLDKNYNFNASVDHQFARVETPARTSFILNINRTLSSHILTLGTKYSDNGDYGANIALTTSFGYDNKTNSTFWSGNPMASNGAILVKVFLDENGNGKFDIGEVLLPDVEVKVAGSNKVKTNKNGVAFISNITAGNITKINLVKETLKDPYWTATKEEVDVITHNGTIFDVEFPVLPSGLIEGHIFLVDKNQVSPAANATIELVDLKGDVVAIVTSAYDGFFLFENVPLGEYKLRYSAEQSERLGIVSDAEKTIKLQAKNYIINDVNFTLHRQEKSVIKSDKNPVEEKISPQNDKKISEKNPKPKAKKSKNKKENSVKAKTKNKNKENKNPAIIKGFTPFNFSSELNLITKQQSKK